MTDEQMRAAIAEVCGWKYHCMEGMAVGCWIVPHQGGLDAEPPDYPNDLNAMYEAESTLLFSRRQRYYEKVKEIMSRDIRGTVADIECIRATARQRAEAFCSIINKCK